MCTLCTVHTVSINQFRLWFHRTWNVEFIASLSTPVHDIGCDQLQKFLRAIVSLTEETEKAFRIHTQTFGIKNNYRRFVSTWLACCLSFNHFQFAKWVKVPVKSQQSRLTWSQWQQQQQQRQQQPRLHHHRRRRRRRLFNHLQAKKKSKKLKSSLTTRNIHTLQVKQFAGLFLWTVLKKLRYVVSTINLINFEIRFVVFVH